MKEKRAVVLEITQSTRGTVFVTLPHKRRGEQEYVFVVENANDINMNLSRKSIKNLLTYSKIPYNPWKTLEENLQPVVGKKIRFDYHSKDVKNNEAYRIDLILPKKEK